MSFSYLLARAYHALRQLLFPFPGTPKEAAALKEGAEKSAAISSWMHTHAGVVFECISATTDTVGVNFDEPGIVHFSPGDLIVGSRWPDFYHHVGSRQGVTGIPTFSVKLDACWAKPYAIHPFDSDTDGVNIFTEVKK